MNNMVFESIANFDYLFNNNYTSSLNIYLELVHFHSHIRITKDEIHIIYEKK